MEKSAPFRLNRSSLLLALVSAAFAGQAAAAAGRVEFALGGASIVGADGRTRTAARGTELDSGDLVRTNDGRVQVRMTDGSYISLQPNTEFGIKEYKFSGKADGTESAFYSLLKGAMRTVTGLIGRTNRNRYQVATPTATVGIRGTGGLIQVLNDGSTLVQGTSGIWFLANPAGSIDVPAGVAGLAPSDPKQPPKETAEVPTSGPAPLPPQQEYVQGDQRTDSGQNVITGDVLQSGSGYNAVFAYGFFTSPNLDASDAVSAVFNSGQLTSADGPGFFGEFNIGTGSHAEFGTDGILAWGRWIGDVFVGVDGSLAQTYDGNQGLHYVVGLPTPSMPQTGTATYTLLGATRPTLLNGTATTGSFSGILTANFDVRSPSVLMDLNITVGAFGYRIDGSAGISGATFSGSFGQNQGVSGTAGGACGGCSCSADVKGFFAGTNAARAGLGYQINDSSSGTVLGAAAFKKQ